MNTKIKTIDEAIENKNVITFTYENLQREVEPYHHGILGGKQQLHSFQLDGQSNSGGLPEWRNFEIDKMTHVSINKNKHFRHRSSYHPNNSNYTSIEKSIT